jgi:hypothetical protein
MPPNTHAALTGYTVVGLEAWILNWLFPGLNGRLAVLLGSPLILISLIGWFYFMSRVGLYEQDSKGEL